jgi:glycosyltransferase involved in cell wall biosynthesis
MFNYEFPPLGGGTGVACSELLHNLAQREGVRVDLITSGLDPEITEESLGDSIKVYRLPVGKRDLYFWRVPELIRWLWGAFWLARKLTQESEYDVCHCWSGWPAGILGYLLHHRVPYFVSLRGSDVPGYSSRTRLLDFLIMRDASKVIWRNASRTVAVSSYLRSRALYTAPDLDIEVIANGINTEEFHPGPSSDRYTILFVGRLIKRKGCIYLLKAFEELLRHPQNNMPRLLIAGDGPEKSRLEKYCRENGFLEHVEFAGHLERSVLPDVYRRANLFVLPTLAEGMSNALLEALASGLPVIVSPAGADELVMDNGYVESATDVSAISSRIQEYMSNPALEERHGMNSRATAESMSWSAVTDWYMRTYQHVAKQVPRGAIRASTDALSQEGN